MKVKVKVKKEYTVTINGKEHSMSQINEMAGMIHLETKDHKDLVISCDSLFDIIQSSIFYESEFDADVVKISPSLTK